MRPTPLPLSSLQSLLSSFTSSGTKFQVITTIPHNTTPSSTISSSQARSSSSPPRTLLVLDSSFNPPTIAHHALAISATSSYPQPVRLCLLLSTHNADKALQPAPLVHRLAMMQRMAYTLPAPVDIALTTQPYYAAKAAAIATTSTNAGGYHDSSHDDDDEARATMQQVHIVGADTLARILEPRYYDGANLAPLEPFFARHRLLVMDRKGTQAGAGAVDLVTKLANGGLLHVGGRSEWAARIDCVRGLSGEEVSSTRVRKAVARGDRAAWVDLVCDGVREWIDAEGLYREKP